MKKYFLIILSFFLFCWNLNANWDKVQNVTYRATLWWEFEGTVKLKNTACPSSIEKTYSWNFKKVLNPKTGWCNFNNGKLVCNFNLWRSIPWPPANKTVREVSVIWTYKNIFENFWVPKKITSAMSNNDKYEYSVDVEYWLVTDNNWRDNWWSGTSKNMESLKKDFWVLEYTDESECQPRTCKTPYEILAIKLSNQKEIDSIQNAEDKEKKKQELENKLSLIRECPVMELPASMCKWECARVKWPSIKNGINSWELWDFSIAKEYLDNKTCTREWNHFYCYASDNLKFSFNLSKVGDWVDRFITSINNFDDTDAAFTNNNTEFFIKDKFFEIWKDYSANFNNTSWFTKKSWSYTIVAQWNKGWNPAYQTNALKFKLTIVPNPEGLKWELVKISTNKDSSSSWKTDSSTWKSSTSWDSDSTSWVYANYNDEYSYKVNIKDKYWNPVDPSFIWDVKQDCTWYTPCENLKDKMKILNKLNWDFSVISAEPGEFTESFKLKVFLWAQNWKKTTNTKDLFVPNAWISTASFISPIILQRIDVYSKEKQENKIVEKKAAWPEIWKNQKYEFILKDVWLKWSRISWWKVELDKWLTEFLFEATDFKIIKLTRVLENFGSNLNAKIWFDWILSVLKEKEVLKQNLLKTKNDVKISYNISSSKWSVNTIYDLNQVSLWTCERNHLWAKIIWNIQSSWKAEITGQKANYTDISKSDLSAIIVKNASNFIRNIKSNTVSNWVKYVNWDFTLDSTINYETIIIKNWNLLINKNLDKSIWIIVLNDGTDKTKWNIFVTNNVTKINAFIYAEWTFRSAKNLSGSSYSDEELTKSLDFKWSLFSRNTIWWAVDVWQWFFLPGWIKTTDFNEAQKYDLNFIRKVPLVCDDVNGMDLTTYNIKIEYDPKIQTNPPKLFTK